VTSPRVGILGLEIDAINMEETLALFDGWISRREHQYVCVAAAHTVMSCYHDPELMDIFNASSLTVPDGMSIVWLLKLYGNLNVSRVYGPDLMLSVAERSLQYGWRHFLYGGEEGVPEALKEALEVKYPGIQIVGTYSPPFRTLTQQEDAAITEQINILQPDIVWVGVGTSKQEKWISRHLGRINAHVMIGIGAAFDFVSGRKPQAPRWMQRVGLEWIFRFFTEPVRLFPRYAEYPMFMVLALAELLGIWKRAGQAGTKKTDL